MARFRSGGPGDWLDRMGADKRFAAGRNRFVLLSGIGEAALENRVGK